MMLLSLLQKEEWEQARLFRLILLNQLKINHRTPSTELTVRPNLEVNPRLR